ncbi:unnamed protein product [Symbiodinium microadriaticum]|nr:unnamed protein product [Symbiodinium microadriaticum]
MCGSVCFALPVRSQKLSEAGARQPVLVKLVRDAWKDDDDSVLQRLGLASAPAEGLTSRPKKKVWDGLVVLGEDLPHPKTSESPAEGAVRAARHKSVPLRATMMVQRVAAMFDELRDQVVAMVLEHEQQGGQLTELQGQLAAQTQRVEALEAELQGLRSMDLGQDLWQGFNFSLFLGLTPKSERTAQRKCVVGFLSCGEVFDVIEEWRGRAGTLFLKLAGDKGWVFDKTRTGTFCVPVGSEWQDWRGPEDHKAWMANPQHGSWNNAPSGNCRDRGGDKWKWAWESSKESSSSWKGQEDKWGWDEKDRDTWRHESMQGAATSGSLGGTTARTRRSHTRIRGDAAAFPSNPDVPT